MSAPAAVAAGSPPPAEVASPKGPPLQMQRTLSIDRRGSTGRVMRVTFEGPEPSLEGTSPRHAKQTAWKRKVLQDLQEETNFSSTELEVLLHHFEEQQVAAAASGGGSDTIDKATFFSSLGAAFGICEERLLQAIYTAMDDGNRGFITFSQFVTALSTIYRGDTDDILMFWFRMYDSDRDGFLDRGDFERLLQDVNRTTQKDLQVYVDEEVFPGGADASAPAADAAGSSFALLSFDEFKGIMQDYDVIPIFINPHQFAAHKQAPALRALSPAEREVLLLLGSTIWTEEGQVLIAENDRCTHFFYLLEGEVRLERGGLSLGELGEGSFVGEAALFSDVKAADEDGSKFTTNVKCTSPCRLLRFAISELNPLVYHQHPGATAIVQRLGRIMMERFQQTEERLQALLATSARQSEAGVRLSSKDWAAFRQRLTRQWALRYHKIGRKGKLEIMPTKLMGTKEDLSVAYSPGVAEPCLSIQQNEKYAYEYTAKGHLVGVITNGTAVLGLGNIGPLAGKPVMEGKCVLFKKFADIDAFDIEVKCEDPVKLVEMLVALEPTFGGINLEDIKAPECFFVEKEAQARMGIPVFHDDQHGTAIVAGAGLLNALELIGKDIADIRVVVCGCGAAGFTCAKYFVSLGVKKEHLLAVDVNGVVYQGREDLADPANYLNEVAVATDKRSLADAVAGADVFLGLSAGNLLKPEMLLSMARDPLVFALANPVPEIDPELAAATRPDVIMATGRSDFPNQINNVCAFPFIFKGSLDCRARAVNEDMKRAATYAIAALAKRPIMKRRAPSFGDLLALNKAGEGAAAPTAGAAATASEDSNGQQTAAPSSSTLSTDTTTGGGGGACSEASSGQPAAQAQPHHHHHPRHTNSKGHLRRKSYGEAAFYEAAAAASSVTFGRDYIIPKPFDERLLPEVAGAVLEAAIASGAARLTDIDPVVYRRQLADLALRTNL